MRRSAIHGRGLFANGRFRRGERIGRFRGRTTARDGAYVLWIPRADGSYRGVRGENELRFVNHSPRPNAEFRGLDLYAVREIRPDEEITFDYGEDWD